VLATLAGGLALVAASCSSGPSTTSSSPPTTPARSTTTTSGTSTTTTLTNVPDDTTVGPLGPLQGGAAAVPAPTGPTVPVPASIPADCSKDVSDKLERFFDQLPANSTVLVGAQACYQVTQGVTLRKPQGLTIYGGTFTDDAVLPANPEAKPSGSPAFTVAGGSDVSLENMKINGHNPGGSHSALALAGAINVEGTEGARIEGVTITNPFGDGITLSPLRGGRDQHSDQILTPPTNVVVQDVSITGAGRQAIAIASVSGARITDLVVVNPARDTFDLEADQRDEGADDVSIDGCTASGGALFFENAGSGTGTFTRDITVAHCAMAEPTAGDPVLVHNIARSPTHPRGPLDFVADEFQCGHSAHRACVQLSGAIATIENSVLHFSPGANDESVYDVVNRSGAVFTNDAVDGFGSTGHVAKNSTLQVSGGRWVSESGALGAEPSKGAAARAKVDRGG
jgi:hypothetical protein